MAELRPIRAMQLEKVRNLLVAAVTALHDANAPPQYCSAHRRRNARKYDGSNVCDEAAVARAISWAERILTESEAWFKAHLPQALKS